jgi:L-amino acid N-acyltransferase YncA
MNLSQEGAAHTAPKAKCDVRIATEHDLDAIHRIYSQHVLNGFASFEEIPPDVTEIRRRHRAILDLGLPYLAAEIGGEIVGYSYASPYRARSAYRFTIEDSVYVADEYAGRGIGRALLAALIAGCENGPWRQMVAVIGDSGNSASIALHRGLGFRLAGTLHAVGFKRGRWVDTVLMQRALGEGDRSAPA